MGLAVNSATFMRRTKRSLHHFLALVLIVSTLSAVSIVKAPEASASLTNENCAPVIASFPTNSVTAVASGSDCIITFTSGTGTWTTPLGVSTISIVVVGGGGGGGGDGGSGGGGGELRTSSSQSVTPGSSATISIGAGGAGGSWLGGVGTNGKDGSPSTVTVSGGMSYSATGGKGGGGWQTTAGGFGGGAGQSGNAAGSGGNGTPGGQGGGGPGNCVAPAPAATVVGSLYFGAVGTDGPSTTVIGTPATNYGGGGGGGLGANTYNVAASPVENGRGRSGGAGGGGRGSNYKFGVGNSTTAANGASSGQAGNANTGGGGGGGSACDAHQTMAAGIDGYTQRTDGGAGGSGVVIVRFTVPTLTTPSTPDLVADSDTGISSTDNVTRNRTPTFTGTASPGSSVQLQIGSGSPVVYANTGSPCTTNSSGAWTCTTGTLGTFVNNNLFRAVSTFGFGTSTTSSTLTASIFSGNFTEPSNISWTNGSGTLGIGETANILFLTSTPIYGFTVDDLTVSGGTISNFVEVNARRFTAVFTPLANASGTASISVGANKVSDTAGNSHSGSATFTLAYNTVDSVAPTLSTTTTSSITTAGVTLNFTSSETGTYFYKVQSAASADPADAAAVESTATANSSASASANSVAISGLSANTDYEIFTIVKDAAGNRSAVTKLTFSTLAAAVAPTIGTQPTAAARTVGQSVTFTVAATASDSGVLSYQWQKGGSNINGANSASYTFTPASASDAGDYRVVVTNTKNSTSTFTNSNAVKLSIAGTNNHRDFVSSTPGGFTATGRSFGSSSQVIPSGSFTIEGWFNESAGLSNPNPLFSQGSLNTNQLALLIEGATNNRRLILYDGLNTTTASTSISLGKWSHYAVTFDGSTIKIYLNGVEVASKSSPTFSVTTGNFSIGQNNYHSGHFYHGKQDQVKIWSAALSADEIASSMHSYGEGNVTGKTLRTLYDFNLSSGNDLTDVLGSANLSSVGTGTSNAWASSTLNVTFDEQGGSPAATDTTFDFYTRITNPGSPAKTGFTFSGWSRTSNGSVISFPYIFTPLESVTLYAIWSGNSNTVTFNANDGSGTPATSTQSITSGSATALNANAFTRTGYVFNGWNTNADGTSGTGYSNQQSVTLTGGLTLFAKWIQTFQLTVTQSSNGTISPSSTVVNSGSDQTFTFTPNAGYNVATITVNGVALTGSNLRNAIGNGYTFTNITSAHTITATYATIVTTGLLVNLDATNSASLSAVNGASAAGWASITPGGSITPLGGASVTVSNGTTGVSPPPRSVYFGGSSSYLNYGKASNVALSNNAVTVETWMNLSTVNSDWEIIATKWFADTSRNENVSTVFHFGFLSNRLNVYARGASVGAGTCENKQSNTIFNSSQYSKWIHVAFTIDASGNLKFYLNGVEDGSHTGCSFTDKSNALLIVGDLGANNSFTGSMSRFRMYGSALTAAEIKSNYMAEALTFDGSYLLNYNYNSATSGNTDQSASFKTGDTAITLPTPSRTNYTFGGWYVASDFSGTALGSTYSPTSSLTIHAKWTGTLATLSGLTLSSGTLSTTFASATTSYTASVANSVDSITVTPIRSQENATITVNGTAVTSGSASGAISLNVGSNTITVVVTAQSGSTSGGTYTLTVTRAAGISTVSLTIPSFTFTGSPQGPDINDVTKSGSTGNVTFAYVGRDGTSYPSSSIKPTNVGTYTVTATVAADANFATVSASGNFAITNASLVITPTISASSMVFGTSSGLPTISHSKNPNLTLTTDPTCTLHLASDTSFVTAQTLGATLAAGSYVVRCTGAALTNYTITYGTNPSFTVAKRDITLTVGTPAATPYTGSSVSVTNSFTRTSGTLAGSDAISGMTYTYTSAGGYNSTTSPTAGGSYTITGSNATFSTGSASNYTITYVAGALTISTANQTVTWAPITSLSTTSSPATPSALATALGSPTISYAVTSAGTTGCTVNSSTAVLTFTAAGSCQVTATAAATSNYATASTVVTFVISLTTYTITLAAGTNGTGSNQTLTKTNGVNLTLPDSATANGYFTRTGYSVTGWSTTNQGSQTHALGGAFTTEAITTLYPVWTGNTLTVTLEEKGGTTVADGSVAVGATLSAPTSPTKAGSYFLGWSATDGGVTVSFPYTHGQTANFTLYAIWTVGVYSTNLRVNLDATNRNSLAAGAPTSWSSIAPGSSFASILHRGTFAPGSTPGAFNSIADSFVSFGHQTAARITGDITVEAWVKLDANYQVSSTDREVANHWVNHATAQKDVGSMDWYLRIVNGRLTLFTSDLQGVETAVQSGVVISNSLADKWIQIGFTQLANGSVQFFLNGAPTGNALSANPRRGSTTARLLIGNGSSSFIGSMSKFRMYAEALTSNQIRSNYNLEAATFSRLEIRDLTIDSGSYSSSYTATATPPTISATASVGTGSISYTSSTTSVCTVNSSTGVVAFVTAGTCTVSATIAADSTYDSATSASVSFTVTLATRTLTIDAGSFVSSYGMLATAPTITSTASAGLGAKSYTSSTTAVCTINSSSGLVAFVAPGTCTIAASIAASSAHSSATASSISFVITSSTATLSALILSSGILSPSFASGTTTYTASVANSLSTGFTVTPTTTQANATTVQYLGADGTIPFTGALAVGANVIRTIVTAQDGTTTSTYTLTVTRAVQVFTITYAAGTGGSGSGPTSPTTVNSGATFTTPANTYSQIGYAFSGWSDGTNSYAVGATYPQAGSVSGNVTLTATWTIVSCSPTSIISGGFKIFTFTAGEPCYWSVPSNASTVDVLVVGGGGGGAGNKTPRTFDGAGAGGGGGAYSATAVSVSGNVLIGVGRGGGGGTSSANGAGNIGRQGNTTNFGSITAGGGGGGGCDNSPGLNLACTDTTRNGQNGTAGGGGGGGTNYYNAYNFGNGGTGSAVTIGGVTYSAQNGFRGGYYNDGGSSATSTAGPGGGARSAANRNTPGSGLVSTFSGTSAEYGKGGSSFGVAGWTFRSSTPGYGTGGDGAYHASAATNGADGADGVVMVRFAVPSITYAAGTGGGGTGPSAPSAVDFGATFTTPANTFTRAGYTFAGWSDGTSVFQAGVTYPTTGSVSANVTLTATWTANTNVVVFNNNTGAGTMTSQDIVSGTATTLTSNTFTKTGHTFAGWNTNANGTSGTNYTDGQSVTITAGMTLFAKWTIISYTITYAAGTGGSGTGPTTPVSVNHGSTFTTPANTFIRNGFTFAGWQSDTSTVGANLTFPTSGTISANVTLTATWTPTNCTIAATSASGYTVQRVTANGSCIWVTPTGISAIEVAIVGGGGGGGFGDNGGGGGAGEVLVTGTATLSGTTVTGTSTISTTAGAETLVTIGTGGTSGAPTGSTEANAVTAWGTSSTTSRFGGNGSATSFGNISAAGGGGGGGNTRTAGASGGSGGGAASGGTLGAAGSSSATSGWTSFRNAGSIGGAGSGGGAGSVGTNARGGSGVTVFGVRVAGGGGGWAKLGSENSLTDTALGGNGRLGGATNWQYAGSAGAYTSDGVAGTGTGGGGGARGGSGSVIVRFATIVDYTYDANGGTGTAPAGGSVQGGTTFTTAANPFTRTGYTFAGWYTTSTGTGGNAYTENASNTMQISATAIILYAKWTIISYTITYAAGTGGSGSGPTSPISVNHGSTFTVPANTFIRNGYTFTGWSDGANTFLAAATYPATGAVTANVTLTATWETSICSPTSTTTGGYTIYTFTTVGTCLWTVPNGLTDVEIFAVAGGGGGGYSYDNSGAGGGAGGQLKTGTATLSTTLEVTVGAGGSAGIASSQRGGTGANSAVSTITALGGTGGCASRATTCSNSAQATSLAAANGGIGGAGGASGRGGGGSNTTGSLTSTTAGGTGTASTFSGSSVTYGVGGAGGTARGALTNLPGTAGSANTGNGGGGASARAISGDVNGGAGGSGLVIVRVASALTITFNSQSGSDVAAGSTVTGGSISAAPTPPTRANHNFLGWFTASTGGTAIAFPYVHGQTANFTLFAQWSLSTYAITFNANNGTGSMGNQSFTHGVAANLNANLYSRANYVFHRWATEAGGTGDTYNNLAQITLTAGITLYAQWTANTYVVTYSYNGADGGESPATAGFTTAGTAITLPVPTRTGFTFAGWHSDAALTTLIGSNNGSGTYSPTGATLSLNAYAKWTAISYTFTYDANSADSGSIPTETNKQITQSATVKANTGSLVRAGYTFGGWNTQSNGGGTNYLSGSLFTVGSSNVILYAKWNANTYTITYNINSGSGNAQRTVSSVATNVTSDSFTTGGASVVLPDAGTLTRTGYTFGGWNTSAAGTGTNRLAGATFTTVSDVIFYAKWNPITYTITYDENTGTGTAPTAGGYTTGQATPYVVLTNTFTKTSNVFGGWNTAANGTGISYSPGASITTLANIVLYAVWIPQFTLHYAINGGTVNVGSTRPADTLYNVNTSVATFSALSRTGYTFDGWTNGASTITPGGNFTIVQDSVLTAKWTAINYTITYNSDGGTEVTPQASRQIGQSFTVASAPSKPGHNFTGWSNGSTVVGADAVVVMGSANIAYTAQWVPRVYTITYDWNGGRGTEVPDVNYTFGTTAITLPLVGDRVRDGFTFTGWSEGLGGSALGATYIPSQSRTLFARWDVGSFTITYNLNRGTLANSTVSVPNTSATVLPLPTRANFVFDGWHTATVGGSLIGTNGASFTPTSSQTVYARWIQASLFGITNSLTRIGSVITVADVANTFSGANSNSSVSVSVPANALPAGTTINFDMVGNSSRATGLLPNINYLISIAISWQTADGLVPDTAANKPISVTISNATIKTGATAYAIVNNVSTLLGTASQDGTITIALTSDPEVVVAAVKPGAPTNVSATSSGNQQSVISWSAPTTNGGSAITGYTVTANTGGTCTTSAFSCTISNLANGTAYTFTVTATNSVGTSVASSSASATTAALYAVTFDAKGGTAVSSGSFLTASTVSEPTAPTRAGYSFAGWSATDGGSAVVFPYAPGVTTAITLFARWDALDNAVNFDSKGGSDVTASVFSSGGTVAEPTAPTRAGYTFAGWSASDGGTVVTFPYAPGVVTDITLYAKWTIVSQNNSGGGGSSVPAPSAPSEPAVPSAPVRSNVTVVAPVTIVGDQETKLIAVQITTTAVGSDVKPPAIKLDVASEKIIAEVKVVEGKLVLTPEAGFSGRRTVTVTVTENGADRFIQIPLTVLPEAVTKPVLTPTAANRTVIRWTQSPNATAYTVLLNGKRVCTTSASNCSVSQVLGPNAVIEVVSNGGDRTVSERIEADFRQNIPVAITRLVSATNTKNTLSRVDTKALDRVVSLIRSQGFGTVVISEISTTSRTASLAAARLAAIKKYIDEKTGSREIAFEVVPATSRTNFNNISVKG
jgi:uncharacterized repeat protein (TIGR02543 family)